MQKSPHFICGSESEKNIRICWGFAATEQFVLQKITIISMSPIEQFKHIISCYIFIYTIIVIRTIHLHQSLGR